MDHGSISDEIVKAVSQRAVSDVFGAWKYLRYLVHVCAVDAIADEYALRGAGPVEESMKSPGSS